MGKNREYLILSKENISSFGEDPNSKNLHKLIENSLVIVDKDVGPNSHTTADNLKFLLKKYNFEVSKVGHSGTLDPMVSGLLVCGINKATRLMEYMLKSKKRYICLMFLHKSISFEKIEKSINGFKGEISQLPPIVSAVKREVRKRHIYSIDVLERSSNNQYVLIDVSCERGTYIRKLCSDIGEDLGVNCQMVELRRIKVGPFDERSNFISLDALRNYLEIFQSEKDNKLKNKIEQEIRKYVLPCENLMEDFREVIVKDSCISALCHGVDLRIPGIVKIEKGIEKDDLVSIKSQKGELIGVGKVLIDTSSALKSDKGTYLKILKIVMDTNLYPRNL